MPLESCPIDDKTLAEYSLGPGRTRLSPEECARVEAHLAVCEQCRRDHDLYVRSANTPGVRAHNPDADESLIVGTQNVMARLMADITAETQKKARIDAGRKWRTRAAFIAAGVAVVTALLFFLLDNPLPPPPPPPPPVIVIQEPGPGELAENLTEEEKAAAVAEAKRANADLDEIKAAIASLPPAEGLARLAQADEQAGKETAPYRNAAYTKLASLYEQLLTRARGKPEEDAAMLALSRAYLAAGLRNQWFQTFERYAARKGDAAYQAVSAEDKSANEIDQAERVAKATAFFEEVKHYHDAKDYSAAIQLNERLVMLYPRTAQAWEGLTVAARCYLANGQPAGAIASYKKIMDECPDELFAREAAKALLKMYLYADQLDNAVEQARSTRKRFQDNDFKAFAFLMEGVALERKGEPSYPAAIKAYREAYATKTGSPYAGEANEHLAELRAKVMKELKLDKL